jgi:hypothetical protein
MAKKKRPELPEGFPEYLVSQETLMHYFDKPIGRTTFFKLANEGKIVRMEGIQGLYKLNISLLRMGLQPTRDLPAQAAKTAKALKAEEDEKALHLALWLLAEDAIHTPPFLVVDEVVSPELQQRAKFFADAHGPNLETLTTTEERRSYVDGVLIAAHWDLHPPE